MSHRRIVPDCIQKFAGDELQARLWIVLSPGLVGSAVLGWSPLSLVLNVELLVVMLMEVYSWVACEKVQPMCMKSDLGYGTCP